MEQKQIYAQHSSIIDIYLHLEKNILVLHDGNRTMKYILLKSYCA